MTGVGIWSRCYEFVVFADSELEGEKSCKSAVAPQPDGATDNCEEPANKEYGSDADMRCCLWWVLVSDEIGQN